MHMVPLSRCSPHPGPGQQELHHSQVASPLHRLTEQHDDLLLHVVLPRGLHGHHGRHVAANREKGVRAIWYLPEPRVS